MNQPAFNRPAANRIDLHEREKIAILVQLMTLIQDPESYVSTYAE